MKLRHLILLPPLFLLSCGASDDAPKAGSSTATGPKEVAIDLEGGATFFAETCTPCHGAKGKGDGAPLVPKPRDLTDKAWQDSVDDEYIRKIIQYGGSAVGKAATMPANPVLASKPGVMKGLIAHIRNLAK